MGPRSTFPLIALLACAHLAGVLAALWPQATRAAAELADKAAYLSLARQGWVFEMRSTLLRRDPALPSVRFDAKAAARGAICVYGAPPRPATRALLGAFDQLLRDLFDRTAPMTFAGAGIEDCPEKARIYLRLYRGDPLIGVFNDDLRRLDRIFGIGLPDDRLQQILSPAQASGFFGRGGDVAHILAPEGGPGPATELEAAFRRSTLLEELFQVVSFGVDIPVFDRDRVLISKLQEHPVYLKHLRWRSPAYMEGLLGSNPGALCAFDVFMLHALAASPFDSSNSEGFITFIDGAFDDLAARAAATMAAPRLAVLFDPACAAPPALEPTD